jgi:heme exporter protein D
MGFFIGLGVVLAVVLVIALVMDRADRKRGVKHGMLRPRGRRPRMDDVGHVGNDLRHYEPPVRGEDRRAPREDEM